MQLLGVAYNCMSQLYSERAGISIYARVCLTEFQRVVGSVIIECR
jgi:hypothetical protein